MGLSWNEPNTVFTYLLLFIYWVCGTNIKIHHKSEKQIVVFFVLLFISIHMCSLVFACIHLPIFIIVINICSLVYKTNVCIRV